MVSFCSDVSIIRHMASRVRERGVGTAYSSLLAQSELLLVTAELDDRHLFRVELISAHNKIPRRSKYTMQINASAPAPPATVRSMRRNNGSNYWVGKNCMHELHAHCMHMSGLLLNCMHISGLQQNCMHISGLQQNCIIVPVPSKLVNAILCSKTMRQENK